MKKGTKVFIILILSIILGVGGYFIYTNIKLDDNSNNNPNNNLENVQNVDKILKEKFEEKASNYSSINEYVKYLLSFSPSKFDDNGKLQSINRNYLNDDPKNISYVIYKYIFANERNQEDEKLDADGYYKTSTSVDKVNQVLKEYYDLQDFDFVPLYIEDTSAYGLEKVNDEYVTKTVATDFSFPTYNIEDITYEDNLVKISVYYDYQNNPNADRVTQNGKLTLKYNNDNFNFEKIEFEN